MLRIGLTGGIGSGKSAAAESFARRGVPIIDTDIIAREVVQRGEPALSELVREFGDEILDTTGMLDRARLRRRVFDDSSARARLQAILHPRIRARVTERLSAVSGPYAIVVVPLLVETGFRDLIDRVLVIDADEARQIDRASARDITSPEAIKKILATQAKREERLARADDVIVNNGTLEDLDREVGRLHAHYLTLAGVG